MQNMENLRDSAIEGAVNTTMSSDEKVAFSQYAQMAKFLDENFSRVESVPQTAPMPIATAKYVWHACSTDITPS